LSLSTAPLLELDAVNKSFGSVVVADELTFSVFAGEALGVVGPNGAGKTTMLNLICGSVAADSGRIRLDGQSIEMMPAYARARLGVGRTYQMPRPFAGMNVFENVQIAATYAAGLPPAAADAAAVDALARTGLLARANATAGALPLLDRKRLELARAVAGKPRLLLLDEIAGGLSEGEVGALVETLRQLRAEGMTLVWIEHIVHALVSLVDRLMATDAGRKLIEGDPRTVIASPEVRAVYLGREATA
jgi:branched-chain amino acid transport system ATP-binding protein